MCVFASDVCVCVLPVMCVCVLPVICVCASDVCVCLPVMCVFASDVCVCSASDVCVFCQ